MAKIPNNNILDRIIRTARYKRGARPEGYYDHMRLGSPKYIDDEWNFKIPSSYPGNVESFRKDGMSYKMIPSDRIYANQWYADPNNKIEQGYDPSMSDADFKRAFIARSRIPTLEQREMAQRAYDKKVGRDVAREYARYVNQNPVERYGYESPVRDSGRTFMVQDEFGYDTGEYFANRNDAFNFAQSNVGGQFRIIDITDEVKRMER